MADPAHNPNESQSNQQLFTLLKHRTTVYKFGLLGLFVCFGIYIVAFSTPHWIEVKFRSGSIFDEDDFQDDLSSSLYEKEWGLWNAPCDLPINSCNTGLVISQIVFFMYLGGYVLSIAVAFFENFRRVDLYRYHSRKLEFCMLLTGVLGTAGICVFVFLYSISIDLGGAHNSFKWSMSLTSLSLTGIYISFLLVICGNKKPQGSVSGVVIRNPTGTTTVQYNPNYPNSTVVIQGHGHLPPPQGNPQYPPQYPPQAQPLLPPQPYQYPPASQSPMAPPSYALPPPYQASVSSQSATAPAYNYQPGVQYEKYGQASAPPNEEYELPKKS